MFETTIQSPFNEEIYGPQDNASKNMSDGLSLLILIPFLFFVVYIIIRVRKENKKEK